MNNGQSNNQGEFDEGLALNGDAATAMQNVAQALSMEDDDMTQGDTPENENGEKENNTDEYDGGINEEAIAHLKAEIEALSLMLEKKYPGSDLHQDRFRKDPLQGDCGQGREWSNP